MRKETSDALHNLLKDITVNVHIHTDAKPAADHVRSAQVEQLQLLDHLLSRSTIKLQTSLANAGKQTAAFSTSHPENPSMKSPLDQALTDLTETVTAQTSIIDSAIAFIDGVPVLLQQAHDAGVAAGATPQQLGALSGLIANMKAESDKLKAAVVANTTTPPPALSLMPTSGFDGTTVIASGAGFGAAPGAVTVSGAPAQVTSWSDTSVTFIVPVGSSPGATDVTVDVVVTPATGAAQTAQFTVTPDPNA
jgi:hypothetical protein